MRRPLRPKVVLDTNVLISALALVSLRRQLPK